MTNLNILYFRVSMVVGTRRKYYYFSTIKKAQRFIKDEILDYWALNGHPPVDSFNLQARSTNMQIPKIIDEKPFKIFLAEYKSRQKYIKDLVEKNEREA